MQKKSYPANVELIKEGNFKFLQRFYQIYLIGCFKPSFINETSSMLNIHLFYSIGDNGDNMYVLDEGTVSVTKGQNREFITDLSSGMLFGELAILHNCRRTATIISKTKVSVWFLERHIFQAVVRSAGEQRDQERLQMLMKVIYLSSFFLSVFLQMPNARTPHNLYFQKGQRSKNVSRRKTAQNCWLLGGGAVRCWCMYYSPGNSWRSFLHHQEWQG